MMYSARGVRQQVCCWHLQLHSTLVIHFSHRRVLLDLYLYLYFDTFSRHVDICVCVSRWVDLYHAGSLEVS